MTPTVNLPREVVEFLYGAAPLEGIWYGEKHPNKKGLFWWREYIRAALDAPQAPNPKEPTK